MCRRLKISSALFLFKDILKCPDYIPLNHSSGLFRVVCVKCELYSSVNQERSLRFEKPWRHLRMHIKQRLGMETNSNDQWTLFGQFSHVSDTKSIIRFFWEIFELFPGTERHVPKKKKIKQTNKLDFWELFFFI